MTLAAIPLFPARASTMAAEVDALFGGLILVSVFFSLLIAGLIVFFAVYYREGSGRGGGAPVAHHGLEAFWIAVPLGIVLFFFVWSARVFMRLRRPPSGAMEILVVGKQWMWRFQHPEGQREINTLHVPTGQPIKIEMISEDVLHSLYFPAFRTKMDVVPGRYTTLWFEATKPGRYHLFCAEYCGTSHARMRGTVTAMEPAAYVQWLAGGEAGRSLSARGAELFSRLGCKQCHIPGEPSRGPELTGLFGKRVDLEGGGAATADAEYIRESVLEPRAKIVRGYEPLMPSFAARVGEEEINALIEYIKGLEADEIGGGPG